MPKMLRLPDVLSAVGLSRSRVYALMAEGKFPQALKLSDRAVGWPESTIAKWLKSRGAA